MSYYNNNNNTNHSSNGNNGNNIDGFEWDPTELFTEPGDLSEGFDVLPSLDESGAISTGTNNTYSSANNKNNNNKCSNDSNSINDRSNNNLHNIEVLHPEEQNQHHQNQSQNLSQFHYIPITTQLGMESYMRGREGMQINFNNSNNKNQTTSLTATSVAEAAAPLRGMVANITESDVHDEIQHNQAQEYDHSQRINQMGLKLSTSASTTSGVKNMNSLLENAAKKNTETIAHVANRDAQIGSNSIPYGNFDEQSVGSMSSGEERDDKSAMNASNSNMKAKAKNREHARNTRKRKKEYIESLRDTLNLLLAEREQHDRNRRVVLSRLVEFDNVRKKVLQTFFYYQSCNEQNVGKWSHILTSDFNVVMPVTPYRSFPAHQVKDGVRHVTTIDEICQDTASLHAMAQNLGKTPSKTAKPTGIVFYLPTKDMIMQDSVYMCRWVMKTENAVAHGAKSECSQRGMCRATFNTFNKISSLDITYDVMSFMQEIRRASGDDSFPVVPNNSEIAINEINEVNDARIITEVTRPFAITKVNKAWEKLCGYSESDVMGKNCSFLQGGATNPELIQKLRDAVKMEHAHTTVLRNYKRDGEEFSNFLRLYPLYNNSNELSHYLGILGDTAHHNNKINKIRFN
jgi:PAS domain S-box-containing protein